MDSVTAVEVADAERVMLQPRSWRWRLASAVWLIFLADAVWTVATADVASPWRVLGLAGMAVFCAAYVVAVPRLLADDVDDRTRRLFVGALFVLASAELLVAGHSGLSLYVFVAVVSIMLLETREAVAVVVFLLVLAPLLQLVVPGWPHTLYVDLPIATASAAVFAVVGVINRNRALARAHEELKAVAVERERARFARDLHDLLGHSLTVITVKSELAKRLAGRDPARARAEMADVERLSREALADVRSTVAGYRGVTLAAEVAAARSALDAAGIRADLPGAVDDVPGERRELFGWVVREGVTNVVRHSGARSVRVSVTPTSVEVVDDGAGDVRVVYDGTPAYDGTSADGGAPDGAVADAGRHSPGHGLSGLRERLAAAGGRLEAGSVPGGGFRLRAEVTE